MCSENSPGKHYFEPGTTKLAGACGGYGRSCDKNIPAMNNTVVSGLKMTCAGRRAMAALGSILSSESQLSSAAALVLITSLKQTLVTKCFEVGQNLETLAFLEDVDHVRLRLIL